MPRPSMLDAAIAYAREGYRVHPLRPGTKVPILAAWQTEATTDIETIATWWGSQYPDANVGIATGAESDLWVLDIDTGHGPDAQVSLDALLAAHGPLPDTLEVVTPSGGTHLWFRWPAAAETSDTWRNTKALGAGIDVRAEGGQVAVWPSVLADGTRYRKPKGKRRKLPTWLADKTRHREPDRDGVRVQLADLTPASASAAQQYGQRAIEAVITDLQALASGAVPDWSSDRSAYAGPSWDDATFTAACRLLRLAHADWTNLTDDDAESLLRQHAPTDGGFGAGDHERIIRSARVTVNGDAATLPATLLAPLPLLQVPGRKGDAEPEAPADPEGFFDKAGLRVAAVAMAVDEGDLAVGSDGLLWRYDGGVYRPDDDVVTARAVRLLGNRWRSTMASSVNQRVRHAHPLPRLGDEPHGDYLNLRSGMLDWRTGVLLEHSPAFRSTVQLPMVFDPAATCPAFDRWASEVVADDVLPQLLEVIGYLLMAGNPLQRAILLYGTGGNGKGTLIRVLRAMIGAHNTSSVTLRSMAEGRFEVAELVGKQANLAGDIDPRFLKDTANFKALTGGDVVQAQRKYGRPFEFTAHATPLFSANEMWRSADASAGYLRRWVVVPMTRPVVGTRALDEQALFAEAPGILNRVLPHLRELMTRREFATSLEAGQLTDRFAEQADLVRTWLTEDDAVIDATPGVEAGNSWRVRTDVFNRFRVWAQESGHQPMSSTRFYERLRHQGYVFQQRKDGRGVWGVTLDSGPSGLRGVSLLTPFGARP